MTQRGTEAPTSAKHRVLVTGASGLVGRQVVRRLADDRAGTEAIVAVDVCEPRERLPGVEYEVADIRDPGLTSLLRSHRIDTVVHLAAVVTAGKESSREAEYSIDVLGTENVIEACLSAGVRRLVYTSSGAAYGYYADNAVRLRETDPLRGNPEFAYSDHKRIVEERLERCRREHPELEQLIFRPGTILGETVQSPISALFERPVVVGVAGSPAPFCFIWDEDVARCIEQGIRSGWTGIYNLTGDGALSLPSIARRLGKPYLPLPAWLLAALLGAARLLRLSSRGPEQVNFLRYRPVLANDRLKEELGFTPSLSSEACFERYHRVRFPTEEALRGQTAIVTGAASGIGEALAQRFARAGAHVAILDVDAAGAERVARSLRDEGRSAFPIKCDVTSAQACASAVERVRAAYGGVDVLVNNAGITHLGAFRDTKVGVIRRVLEVNFIGAIQMTKAALPSLLERRGEIVAIASVAGLAPLATRTGYAASKHAVHGFFASLRAEHQRDGLGVLIVYPSFVDTAIGEHALAPDGGTAHAEDRTGARGAIAPQTVAEAVLRAMQRRRRSLYIPWRARAFVWIARLFPSLYERAMVRRTVTPPRAASAAASRP